MDGRRSLDTHSTFIKAHHLTRSQSSSDVHVVERTPSTTKVANKGIKRFCWDTLGLDIVMWSFSTSLDVVRVSIRSHFGKVDISPIKRLCFRLRTKSPNSKSRLAAGVVG